MKPCRVCGEKKLDTEFYSRKSRRTGIVSRHTLCKSCARARSQDRYAVKRDDILAQQKTYKAGLGARKDIVVRDERRCHACGQTKPAAYFHKDRTSLGGLASICRTCSRQQRKLCYAANPDPSIQRASAWGQANAERRAANLVSWRRRNAAKVAAAGAFRRAMQTRATPRWLGPGHYAEMEGLYHYCRVFSMTGPKEVDHIIPLRGRLAAGLHAPWNLRVLSEAENREKLNKMPDLTMVPAYTERPSLTIEPDGTVRLAFSEE